MKDYLVEQNDLWKTLNYSTTMFSATNKKTQIEEGNMQMSSKLKGRTTHRIGGALNSRIYDSNFYFYLNYLVILILLIVINGFLFGGYALHMQFNGAFTPTLEMTLKVVNFKLGLDSGLMMGELIKSEKFILENDNEFFDEK